MDTINLERQIKKNIYGKPQQANITFPPGFGTVALEEINSILKHLWLQEKFQSKCILQKNKIRIENVHIFSLLEIMLRCHCITDIQLIILEEKAVGKDLFEKKCRKINWQLYLNEKMSVKIKTNSTASKAFHETGLKEILSSIIKAHTENIVQGENTNETTTISAELYKDLLTVSISLAGNPLYKRGYREELSSSAPLREDIAANCIMKAYQYAKNFDKEFEIENLYLPFSGTGTFLFELLQIYHNISLALFDRDFAFKKMVFFRHDNYKFLLKKAKENIYIKNKLLKFLCVDTSKDSVVSFQNNLLNFCEKLKSNEINLKIYENSINPNLNSYILINNFLHLNEDEVFRELNGGNLFIPINPPYGIRFQKTTDIKEYYKKIALKLNKINAFTKEKRKESKILGFILCPNEETWSNFINNLKCQKKDSYHITQGGLDIRVCQFYVQ
ncbi:hypothetical protein ACWNT8_00450 [Pigmentibacter ruber]